MQCLSLARTHISRGAVLKGAENIFGASSSAGKGRHFLGIMENATGEKRQPRRQYETVLTVQNMNPNIVKMEYAVRGPIVQRAIALEKELAQV